MPWLRLGNLASPLASGFLTGRYSRHDIDTATDRGDQRVLSFYASEDNFARLDRLAAAAQEHGVTLSQAAMAYLLSQPLNLFAVVGCRDGAEFRDLWQPNLRFNEAELCALEGAASG